MARNQPQPRHAVFDPVDEHRGGGKKWIIILVCLAVVIGVGVTAYFKGWLDPLIDLIPRGEDTPAVPKTTDSVPTLWPLTGMTGEVVPRPGLVVEIENSAEQRPLTGIESADIVIEEPAQGESTRLTAVFHSTIPPKVSSIGSLSYTDEPRWPQGFVILREESPAEYLDRTGSDPSFPSALSQFDTVGMGCTAQRQGSMIDYVVIQYSQASPTWTWDVDNFRWLRSEGSEPSVSASGSQLSAQNVIVLEADVVPDGTTQVPKSLLVGQGTGIVASGQMYAAITWTRDSMGSMWQFTDPAGEPLVLLPGTTWIEIVPKGHGEWSVF